MVCHNGFIVFPPAAQGKGLGGCLSVHRKGQGKFGSQFRSYSQQLQDPCICSGFVSSFFRQASLNGIAVHPMSLCGIGISHFHMRFVKRLLRRHTHEPAHPPFPNQRVCFQLFKLIFRQIFKTCMAPASALAEIRLLKSVIDRRNDGKQGRKQQCGQSDSKDRNQISDFCRFQLPEAYLSDTALIFYFHICPPC